jgi:predicted RNA-binding Zn ribbon-like protein
MPSEVALRLADVRALREVVRSLLEAVVAGRSLPRAVVDAVNAASAAAPLARALDVSDPAAPAAVDRLSGGSRTAELLAMIARSAIEVIGSVDRERLGRCDAPGCGRFFLTARTGRRWCGAACGTRVRVARHHASRRAGPGR